MLPTSDAVRALGAQLVSDERIIFPVRHHSPACAWQLSRLFEQRAPSVVLVEGPRSFTPLVPLLVHPEARMPLAVYTYAVQSTEGNDKPARRAAYYPFCSHSPELVALTAAHARKIPTRFVDLDFSEQCLIEIEQEDGDAESLLDERHYRRSRYLGALAQQLGCRDHEELWEHLFEVSASTRSLQAHVTDMAAYCHLARVEYSLEELTKDGTLQREAEMAWHIQQALKERKAGDGPVLAVVGGFHAVAMPQLLASAVKRPSISRSAISDESSALIRYSYDRLDRLNGYSAGMTSPAWQQLLWERTLKYDKAGVDISKRVRKEAALTVLFDIAVELRERHGVALPMPTLVAAYEHALQLASLRGRPAPVRDDVFDAVISCFIKGEADADGLLVIAVARRIFSGQAMGKVPPGAGTPPLVKDFEYRARRQRLKIDDSQPRRAVLDIYRRPEHRLTSRLLHGLTLLAVPLAVRRAGPDFVNGTGLDRLQEHWEYAYSAATEAALVEASVYGVTVPLAVANRFCAQLDHLESSGERRDARAAAAFLMHACVLGLHDYLPRVIATLREAIANDAAFESVVAAASSVGLLAESREPLEARDVTEVPHLLKAAYERAIYLGSSLHGDPGEGNELLQALSRLRELLISAAGHTLDANLYWNLVIGLSTEHNAALVRGAATGLLYSAGRMSEAEVGTALDGHLNGLMQPRDAVSFLRGLLYTAREAAWQQSALLGILDKLLQQWDDDAFVATLPELRLAFAEMTPKETDRIADAVAQLHGEKDLGRLVRYDLSAAEVQANLGLSRTLVELLIADGLQAWVQS
ncbi:MAG: hypothetical protein K2Y28_10340 [Burkholderiaceae bacterium]|nr:hypothetical protein [Burkholderiaceae bacterium]